ncbi:MAG: hypothetical protein AAB649_07225, partial [Patescibacteria group bacterium]
FLMRIYGGKKTFREYIFAGLFAGLATVTKPIYVLVVPAVLIALFLYRRELFDNKKSVVAYFIPAAIPLFIWFFVQFSGVSLSSVAVLYANPNDIDIWKSVLENSKRFFTELQPMYALGLFILWTVSGVLRIRRNSLRESITPAELASWILS